MGLINLDNEVKVNNSNIVELNGKNFHLIFNDEFRVRLSMIASNVDKLLKVVDADKYTEKLEDLSETERKKKYVADLGKLKKMCLSGLDEILGKGAGKFVYETYNESTDKCAEVIELLARKADESADLDARKQSEDRMAKYDADK